MKHLVFAVFIALYVIVIAQNWAFYTAAVLIVLWLKQSGDLNSVPFTIGRREHEDVSDEDAPTVTNGT